MTLLTVPPTRSDHVVHFYATDGGLVDEASAFLGDGFAADEAVVLIATRAHREQLQRAFGHAGVDVAAARASGQLVERDAARLLATSMAHGGPDAAAFDASVGELLRGAGRGRPVRAFGEMVGLLWADADPAGAIGLERLWNRLASTMPLSLFCAYPMSLVGPHQAAEFAEVCHLHADVVAGAPAPGDAEVTRRFAGSPTDARQARRFVAEVLAAWSLGHVVDDCALVVSELATNAVRHAGSDFTVSLSRHRDQLRVAVGDASPVPPTLRTADEGALGGRGLRLVQAIADGWWHTSDGDGKIVWAQLRAGA